MCMRLFLLPSPTQFMFTVFVNSSLLIHCKPWMTSVSRSFSYARSTQQCTVKHTHTHSRTYIIRLQAWALNKKNTEEMVCEPNRVGGRTECLSWSGTTPAALKALLEELGRSLLTNQSAFTLTLTETPQTLCDLLVISALRFAVVGFNQLQHHLSVMQMCFCCPVKHCGVSHKPVPKIQCDR